MKTMVYERYGAPLDVLEFKDVEKPIPKDNEVLVKIYAASLNAGDWHFLRGEPLLRLTTGGFLKPRHQILGDDIAGRVEAVGRAVQHFQPGDEVFGISNFGAFAEYRCVAEDKVAAKTANVSFEDAATIPMAGFPTLQALRDKGQIQSGHKVLINGASGGIGTLAVQLAKYYGADVTGVCSTRKMDLVRSIGADHVIDYTQEDFTQRGATYDVIFDVVGKSAFSRSIQSLKPHGYYLLANPGLAQMIRAKWTTTTSTKKVIVGAASGTTDDLLFLKELIEAGTIQSVIDRTYPLEQIPVAHRYIETGQKLGHVVITIEH